MTLPVLLYTAYKAYGEIVMSIYYDPQSGVVGPNVCDGFVCLYVWL